MKTNKDVCWNVSGDDEDLIHDIADRAIKLAFEAGKAATPSPEPKPGAPSAASI